MKIFVITVLSLILAGVALAQQRDSPDKRTGTVSGIVVKEPGSQLLKKATVTLVAENQQEGGNYTAITDSEGHFAMDNVRPGRYRMLLERTGYVEINERQHKFDGRTLSLLPGQELKGLRLTMLMTATVLGRVVDEDGDPIPSVEVTVLRKITGKTRWEPIGSERTNDLGEYRIPGLFPGHYYVAASPPPDYQKLAGVESASDIPDTQPALKRMTTYYPGTTDRSQASSVDLRAGDEIPISLALIPGRTYNLRGFVVGLARGRKAAVVLTAREYSLVFTAAEVQEDGRFEVRGVPPGSYMAMAIAENDGSSFRTAHQRIDVGTGDVEDIRLAPSPAGTVHGQVVSDTPAAFSQGYVMLRSLDDDSADSSFTFAEEPGNGSGAHVDRDGSFEIKNVAAGRYAVEFVSGSSASRDSFVRSVRMSGSPADTGFAINGNTGPLFVTLSSRAAVIEGTTLDDHNKPLADCTVVAVPEEQFRKLPARFGKSRTDQNGHFVIRGLTPGSYTVYAWQDLDGEPYLDPLFLQSQEQVGKSVQAEGGKTTTIAIEASTIPVDTP